MALDALTTVLEHFLLPPGNITIESITGGRINQSYKVSVSSMKGEEKSSFVLQVINSSVFENPDLIMRNLDKLLSHSRLKGLDLVPTREGELWYIGLGGEFYRVMRYVDHSPSRVENQDLYYQAGRAVSEFHLQYWEFPSGKLNEVIENFHHTPSRFQFFETVLSTASDDRINLAQNEIVFVRKNKFLANIITKQLESGNLPYRVTHNDTKIDNILFSDEGQAICLIDFDTVMPGAIAWDIGDSVRSMANSVGEEETNIEKVEFLQKRFEDFISGYASVMDGKILPREVSSLLQGCLVIVYEQGLRFLTDYLNNDQYYGASYPTQNLTRAQIQFALLKQMLSKREIMERVVTEIFPLSMKKKMI